MAHILRHPQQTLQPHLGWPLTETDQLFFAQDSRVASDCFLFFFNTQGLVAIDILPEKSTITASYYTQVVLPKVVGKIHEQRPTVGTQRTLLLHDNASAHKAKVTTTFLSEQGIQVLDHPPYSPDLAPCDFWLFPVLKEKLAGRKFDRVQDLAKAVRSELSGLPKPTTRGRLRIGVGGLNFASEPTENTSRGCKSFKLLR